jgi:hypothetical protein
MPGHVDDFTLVRWYYGDLPKKEMAVVAAHVSSCPHCKERADGMAFSLAREGDDEAGTLSGIRARYSALRDRTRSGRTQSSWLPLGVAVGVAGLAMVTGKIFYEGRHAEAVSVVEKRASMEELPCSAFVKRGARQISLEDGDTLLPGDRLRFIVYTTRPGYLTVFSTDRDGVVHAMYPDTEPTIDPAPFQITGPGSHELPRSAAVGPSSGEETVCLVFSPKQFDRRILHARLKPFLTKHELGEVARSVQDLSGAAKVYRFSKPLRTP